MDKRLKTILIVFVSTIPVVVAYTIYLIKTLDPSASIELLFLPFFAAGWFYFIECIILAIAYRKHLKKVWVLLLPVFLISSIVPIYFLNSWYDALPVKIPKPGKLPVTIEQYNSDKNMIINKYKLKWDSVKTCLGDTIIDVDIDTIIYSLDKSKLFSILIVTVLDSSKKKYCSEIWVGLKEADKWQIAEPKDGLYTSFTNSVSGLKYEQRQEYYRYYSINGSSNKQEIWDDSFKYVFPFHDTRPE